MKTPNPPRGWILAGMLAACSAFSCGPDNGLTLAKVSGKVTFNGQPVENGTIFFMPDESKGTEGPPAVGSIIAGGHYIMSTESSGDGVIVGSHKVGITGVEAKPVADSEVIDLESNPLGYMKAKAKASQARRQSPNAKDLMTDRGGRKYRYVTPLKLVNPQESGIAVEITGAKTMNFDVAEDGSVKIQ
ncbi:hypothetical protein EP7_003585 [Isosphaeraceae bacterium EP7]